MLQRCSLAERSHSVIVDSIEDCTSVVDESLVGDAPESSSDWADEEIQEEIEATTTTTDDRVLMMASLRSTATTASGVSCDAAAQPLRTGSVPPLEPEQPAAAEDAPAPAALAKCPAQPGYLSTDPRLSARKDPKAVPKPRACPVKVRAKKTKKPATEDDIRRDESQRKLRGLLFSVVLGQGSYGCVCLGVRPEPPQAQAAAGEPSSTAATATSTATNKVIRRTGSTVSALVSTRRKCPRMYAVKQVILPTSADEQDRAVDAAWKEVETTRKLQHRNIIEVLGAYREPDAMHIVMRFYAGGTLAQLVEKIGRLNSDVVRHYTTELCQGVRYLHANDIVHRDIKGANILLDDKGGLRIGDFGSSREVSGLRSCRLDSLRGTPHWMAPEVIKQTGHGAAADVWSIGCTVIEMLTGLPPFSEFKAAHATMYAIANSTAPLPLPDECSALCRKFLKSCLNREETQRLSCAKLLESEWLSASCQKFEVTNNTHNLHAAAHDDHVPCNNDLTTVLHHIRKLTAGYRSMVTDLLEKHDKQRAMPHAAGSTPTLAAASAAAAAAAAAAATGGCSPQGAAAAATPAGLLPASSFQSADTLTRCSGADRAYGGRSSPLAAAAHGSDIDNDEAALREDMATPCLRDNAEHGAIEWNEAARQEAYAALDAEIVSPPRPLRTSYAPLLSTAMAVSGIGPNNAPPCPPPPPPQPAAAVAAAAAAGGAAVAAAAASGAAAATAAASATPPRNRECGATPPSSHSTPKPAHIKRRILPAPLRDCPMHNITLAGNPGPAVMCGRRRVNGGGAGGGTPDAAQGAEAGEATYATSSATKKANFDLHNRFFSKGAGGGGGGGGGGEKKSDAGARRTPHVAGRSGIRGASPVGGAASNGGSPTIVRLLRTPHQRPTLTVIQ